MHACVVVCTTPPTTGPSSHAPLGATCNGPTHPAFGLILSSAARHSRDPKRHPTRYVNHRPLLHTAARGRRLEGWPQRAPFLPASRHASLLLRARAMHSSLCAMPLQLRVSSFYAPPPLAFLAPACPWGSSSSRLLCLLLNLLPTSVTLHCVCICALPRARAPTHPVCMHPVLRQPCHPKQAPTYMELVAIDAHVVYLAWSSGPQQTTAVPALHKQPCRTNACACVSSHPRRRLSLNAAACHAYTCLPMCPQKLQRNLFARAAASIRLLRWPHMVTLTNCCASGRWPIYTAHDPHCHTWSSRCPAGWHAALGGWGTSARACSTINLDRYSHPTPLGAQACVTPQQQPCLLHRARRRRFSQHQTVCTPALCPLGADTMHLTSCHRRRLCFPVCRPARIRTKTSCHVPAWRWCAGTGLAGGGRAGILALFSLLCTPPRNSHESRKPKFSACYNFQCTTRVLKTGCAKQHFYIKRRLAGQQRRRAARVPLAWEPN